MLEINSSLRRTKKKLLLIQRIALFLSKTQGRDKLCKILQYLFRFIASHYQIDSYRNIKYLSISQGIKDTRKIFRLFKSVNEYEEMAYILFNQNQNLVNLLKLMSRFCFFFYWAFDNVSILSKIKLFRFGYQRLYRIGSGFWFCALAFMNIALMFELIFFKEQVKTPLDLKQYPSQIPDNCPLLPDFEMRKQVLLVEQSEQQKKWIKRQKWLNLIKNGFDLIPSGKQSHILQIIFNRVIPQNVTGICGFVSAAISMYQTASQITRNN